MRRLNLAEQFTVFRHEYPYREISCGGLTWRYRAGGAEGRPTVLLLPGGTLVPDPLFVIIEATRDYWVIAPAYPPVTTMADLVAGVTAVLDAEEVTSAHVVGSSFGGYLAQCPGAGSPRTGRQPGSRADRCAALRRTGPDRAAAHGSRDGTSGVGARVWRTWRALLTDLGPDQEFWTCLLRDILDHELSKAHLTAMLAAVGDFTGHCRPLPADLAGWHRPVLVLQSEHDRAFARQTQEIRAVYPTAAFHVLSNAGHGAVFTHTARLRA